MILNPESLLDRVFPSPWNPLYHLGALSFYFFWILAVTGLYLFIFFETSIAGAYSSVEYITHEQYYIGSIMRSLHRYASAAMAVSVTLHIIKEFAMKRFQGPRWFSWISGVPLLWLLFAAAIGGYWLVWDERAQYIALSTAELFDVLPIVVEPMAFGFTDADVVSDRFFSLLIFLHVGIPLALLLGMFIHIQRISRSRSFPSKGMAGAVLIGLLVVSIVKPATSMAPADLNRSVQLVEIDWFYMNFYPLIELQGPAITWLLLLGVTVALLAVPLLIRQRNPVIATVDPDYCNGCGWCFADCPYDAIYMKPHDFLEGHQQSVVVEDMGCGICAGACPTATPFKSVNNAFSGINLTDESNAAILVRTRDQVRLLPAGQKILVAGCAHGPDIAKLESPSVTTLSLECTGQLPPSYLDFLCRKDGLDGVLLTGCASGNCFHRSGDELQNARLAHEREPHLRFKDVKAKVTTLWVGPDGLGTIKQKLKEIQSEQESENASAP
jgi:quinol-cytochrome oxidoreductase complex cytochrome b subunit/coenzyme F420-reducing hydrogenase delta subunit